MDTQATEDIEELSYEQAREQLVTVVSQLEAGSATLEESMRLWERGEALANRCQQWLDGARQRLAAVQQDSAAASTEAEAGSAGGQETGTKEAEE